MCCNEALDSLEEVRDEITTLLQECICKYSGWHVVTNVVSAECNNWDVWKHPSDRGDKFSS